MNIRDDNKYFRNLPCCNHVLVRLHRITSVVMVNANVQSKSDGLRDDFYGSVCTKRLVARLAAIFDQCCHKEADHEEGVSRVSDCSAPSLQK
jgi:hypothetical protein